MMDLVCDMQVCILLEQFKMATTCKSDDDELRVLSCINGLFDKDTEQILMKVETADISDVEDELMERYDKEELRSVRNKLFDLAKEKVISGLEDNREDDHLGDETTNDLADQSLSTSRSISQWEAVKRRAKHTLASDTLHFLLFLTGRNTRFPTKLVSAASLDKSSLPEESGNVLDGGENLLKSLSSELDKTTGPVETRIVEKDETSVRYTITLPAPNTAEEDIESASNLVGELSDIESNISSEDEFLDVNTLSFSISTHHTHTSENVEDANSILSLDESLNSCMEADITSSACSSDDMRPPERPVVSSEISVTKASVELYDPKSDVTPVNVTVGGRTLPDKSVQEKITDAIDLAPCMEPNFIRTESGGDKCYGKASMNRVPHHTDTPVKEQYKGGTYFCPVASPVLFSEPPLYDTSCTGIDLVGPSTTEGVNTEPPNVYSDPTVTEPLQLITTSITEKRVQQEPPVHCAPPDTRLPGCRGFCSNCGAAVLLWECNNNVGGHRETKTEGTSTDDLELYIEMAGRTSKQDRYITRRELDELMQNTGQKIRENTSRMDEVMGWKTMITSRVIKIENAVMRNEATYLAQQKEVCERLELMRLWEVEKAAERNADMARRAEAADHAPPIPRRPRSEQELPYESIWDIDPVVATPRPDTKSTNAIGSQYKAKTASTPMIRHVVDPAVAMAGAKRLARQGTMAPVPEARPQRAQGVTFFNHRSDSSQGQHARDQSTAIQPDGHVTLAKASSAPSGLRKPAGIEPSLPSTTRRGAAPQRPQAAAQNGTRAVQHDPRGGNLIDLSGMSSSWYDDDSENDEENGAVGGAPKVQHGDSRSTRPSAKQILPSDNLGHAEISRPSAKQRMPSDNLGHAELPRPSAQQRPPAAQQRPTNVNLGNTAASRPPAQQRSTNANHENAAPSAQGDMRSPQQQHRGEYENGEFVSDNNENMNIVDNRSYANVAASPPWVTPQKRKRKRERSGMKAVPALRSASTTSRKEVYVQGLDYSMCTCHADFEEIVFAHCKAKGVTIVDACTIPKMKSRTEAGCKVTVKVSDYEKLLDLDFWPEGTAVRQWVPKVRGGRRDGEGNELSD